METYWIFFIVFFCIIIPTLHAQRQAKRLHAMRRVRKRKREKGTKPMFEALQRYVGKLCVIYDSIGSAVTGEVKSVDENWLALDIGRMSKEKISLINIDYIMRIHEK